jgi:hypothetical protein
MYDKIKCTRCFIILRFISQPSIRLFRFWRYWDLLLGHLGICGLSVACDYSVTDWSIHLRLACDQLSKHAQSFTIEALFTDSLIIRYDACLQKFSPWFVSRSIDIIGYSNSYTSEIPHISCNLCSEPSSIVHCISEKNFNFIIWLIW